MCYLHRVCIVYDERRQINHILIFIFSGHLFTTWIARSYSSGCSRSVNFSLFSFFSCCAVVSLTYFSDRGTGTVSSEYICDDFWISFGLSRVSGDTLSGMRLWEGISSRVAALAEYLAHVLSIFAISEKGETPNRSGRIYSNPCKDKLLSLHFCKLTLGLQREHFSTPSRRCAKLFRKFNDQYFEILKCLSEILWNTRVIFQYLICRSYYGFDSNTTWYYS